MTVLLIVHICDSKHALFYNIIWIITIFDVMIKSLCIVSVLHDDLNQIWSKQSLVHSLVLPNTCVLQFHKHHNNHLAGEQRCKCGFISFWPFGTHRTLATHAFDKANGQATLAWSSNIKCPQILKGIKVEMVYSSISLLVHFPIILEAVMNNSLSTWMII